jgi:L-amino acid N-acyltransferase YncA
MTIRSANKADALAIVAIYNHYVLNSIITFDEAPASAAQFIERMELSSSRFPWLVAEEKGTVLGYAYASEWKSRCAYLHTAESTIYLDATATGKGIGTSLYSTLLTALSASGFRTAIGGISVPNPGSIALHQKCGFEKIGHFEEVGYKFGKWIDVEYWQKKIN